MAYWNFALCVLEQIVDVVEHQSEVWHCNMFLVMTTTVKKALSRMWPQRADHGSHIYPA